VNDSKAATFQAYDYAATSSGYHQAKSIPESDDTVLFAGSTTGPKYTEQSCSPLQVTWSVRPACMKIDINSVHTWCKKNVFNEHHAHGVRQIVTSEELLAPIN
jgi:hypothetical protein